MNGDATTTIDTFGKPKIVDRWMSIPAVASTVNTVDGLANPVKPYVVGAVNAVDNVACSVFDKTVEVAPWVQQPVPNFVQIGKDTATNAWNRTQDTATNAWNQTSSMASQTANTALGGANNAWNQTTNMAYGTANTALGGATEAWNKSTGVATDYLANSTVGQKVFGSVFDPQAANKEGK